MNAREKTEALLEKTRMQVAKIKQTNLAVETARQAKREAIVQLIEAVFASYEGGEYGFELHHPGKRNSQCTLTDEDFPDQKILVAAAWLDIDDFGEPVVGLKTFNKPWGFLTIDEFEDYFVEIIAKYIAEDM